MVSHSETREYKCQEPFCEKDFTHKSNLVNTNVPIVELCTNVASVTTVTPMRETTIST